MASVHNLALGCLYVGMKMQVENSVHILIRLSPLVVIWEKTLVCKYMYVYIYILKLGPQSGDILII